MYTCDIHKGYPWKKSRECSHGTFHKVKQQPLQLQPEGLKKKKKNPTTKKTVELDKQWDLFLPQNYMERTGELLKNLEYI